jgi:hypothetical protein
MSVDCQDRIQDLSELVRSREYRVDPVAVADAILRRIVWEDVPEVAVADAEACRPQPPRLRGLVRVQRLVPAPMTPQARLSA